MELNREQVIEVDMDREKIKQIIKALELHSQGAVACLHECPYGDLRNCGSAMARDALSLINSQEQDKEKLGLLIDEIVKEKRELFEENKMLTAENERLRDKLERTDRALIVMDKAHNKLFTESFKIKANTVRKMQTEIKKTFSAICKGEMVDLYRIIDQIAKEMLEGE